MANVTMHTGEAPAGDDLDYMPGCVCPKVKEWTWVLFRLQGSETSESISLKMDVKFAASLNVGENLFRVLYMITSKSGENEIQSNG